MQNVSISDQTMAAAASCATDENTLISLEHQWDHIFGDIVFGSPKDDCRGSGICSVVALTDAPAAASSRDCRRATARLQRVMNNAGGADVEVVFQRRDLCSLLMKTVFRKAEFHLPEPCSLPASISEALQLSGNTLLPGRYPIDFCGNEYRIAFVTG